MTHKRILLMLCVLVAAINGMAGDSQRDAILSQITGAQIPRTVINIQGEPREMVLPTVCPLSARHLRKRPAREAHAL